MDDELHAPWQATYTAAELRAALEHARGLLAEGRQDAALDFIAGFLRGPLPPPPLPGECESGGTSARTQRAQRFRSKIAYTRRDNDST